MMATNCRRQESKGQASNMEVVEGYSISLLNVNPR